MVERSEDRWLGQVEGFYTHSFDMTYLKPHIHHHSNIFTIVYIRVCGRFCLSCVLLKLTLLCVCVCSLCSTLKRPCTTSSASTGSSLTGTTQSPKYYRETREVRLCTHILTVSLKLHVIIFSFSCFCYSSAVLPLELKSAYYKRY